VSLSLYALLLLYSHRNSSIVWIGLDPVDYIDVSRIPLLSAEFWTIRPFTVPLAYKLMAQNLLAISLFQVALHGACWVLLAYSVMRSLRNRLIGRVAFAGVLLFSLAVEVNLWNWVILSESISNSLTAAFLAVILLYAKRFGPREENAATGRPWALQWGWPLLILLVGGLWTFCRDNTAYALIAFGPALLLVYGFARARREFPLSSALLLALGCLCLGALQIVLWTHSSRVPWTYTVTTNICHRILPRPEARRFFLDAGMPDSPVLMRFSGKYNEYGINATGPAPDPSLVDPVYDDWVLKHGSGTYTRYLLTHPLQALGWVWEARDELVDPQIRHYGVSQPTLVYTVKGKKRTPVPVMSSRGAVNGRNDLTDALSAVLFGAWPFYWPTALLVSAAPLLFWKKSGRPELWAPLALFAMFVFQGVLVVLADCVEIGRHGLGGAILLRLAFWIALLWILDEAFAPASRPQAGTRVVPTAPSAGR
jgi:hypothetical protein